MNRGKINCHHKNIVNTTIDIEICKDCAQVIIKKGDNDKITGLLGRKRKVELSCGLRY